jgi:hypothetical protein
MGTFASLLGGFLRRISPETILRYYPDIVAEERATGAPAIVLVGSSLEESVASIGDQWGAPGSEIRRAEGQLIQAGIQPHIQREQL